MILKRKKGCVLLLAVLLLFSFLCLPAAGAEENAAEVILEEELPEEESSDSTESEEPSSPTPRDAFIDDIIAAGKEVYDKADGKYKRAHYKNDIYVCKNFTVYVFKQARSKYRMAEFPDTELRIPNNLSAKQCRPYNYGYCWEEIPASKGNPFEIAAQFLYDSKLSKEENHALAVEFMKQTKKGDYFQMTGDYSGGKGAHSAIFISDYDPATNTVRSMDSNRAGKRINGLRYGKVFFDTEMTIDEWIAFICRKKCGATLYRIRDDIIFADNR